jgi:beta-phosphoglucomutase
MIRAILFDLDGTLVKTEDLKSLAYFQAVQAVLPGAVQPGEVEAAYQVVLGNARPQVAAYIVERFHLEVPLQGKMRALGVEHPWQALVALFVESYDRLLADPQTMRASRVPQVVDLLGEAARRGCVTALASMSTGGQVSQVLALSGLDHLHRFDLVLTREQVSRPKPDPEIYLLAASRLGVSPGECLVIEDSTAGVQAGMAAGMRVVALATPLTGRALHAMDDLPQEWIVDDLDNLAAAAGTLLEGKKSLITDEHRSEKR